MSEVKVNKISPRSGTNVQLGDSGDTITVPSGATLDASNATTTLPANVVTTTGTQTLTNKTIGSSQLTGALPALDGSALTGIPDTIAPTRHSIRPSLNLDFANSKALDPRITFTRASNATYYDGYTSVKAEENLVTYSQNFSTSWSQVNVTVTDNSVTAPDGTTTGAELEVTSAVTSAAVYKTITHSTGDTVSVFAKEGTTEFFSLQAGTANPNALFNLNTGTVLASASCTATITSVGNGWYRCALENLTNLGNGYIMMSAVGSDIGTGDAWGNNDAVIGDNVYIWGVQAEKRSSPTSYTPTTSQPITKYQPALQTAGNNVARFDHNPTTGESLGLLIEESRTNLLIISEDFSNANWNKLNTSITSNTIIAPDGTLTGDKIIPDSGSSTHYIYESITVSTGNNYVASVYAKKGGYDYIRINNRVDELSRSAFFNLSNGTVGTVASGLTASIQDVGNGWYRCSVVASVTSSTTATMYITPVNADNVTYVSSPDGYAGSFIWGATYEQGSFPTSYIKTTGSTVTRSSDLPKMENINQDYWFKQSKGTWFVNAKTFEPISNSDKRIIHVDNTTDGSNRFPDIYIESDDVRALFIKQALTLSATDFVSSDTYFKYSVAYEYQNANVAGDGTAQTVNTTLTGSTSDLTKIHIGNYNGSNYFLNGYIKKLTYYPLRLTDNEITDLTEE